MAFKQIKKIVTLDYNINKLQDIIIDVLVPLLSKSHLDSQILTGISLTQGITNNIPHLLGRKPIGYNIVNQYAQADIWNGKISDINHLYLVCSSNVTIDLEVF